MQRTRWLLLLGLFLLSAPSGGDASTIKLQWDVPTLNADGSPLTDLAGYRLTFCSGGTCDPTVGGTDITPDLGLVTTYLHAGRTPGTDYRYAIRTKNSAGTLSPFSYLAEGRAPSGDLVAWWFRNDTGASTTATDAGWFGYPGQLCSGPTPTCPQQGPTWVTGRIQTALHCNGSTDSVQVPDADALDMIGDMTITFWLKLLSTTNLANTPVMFDKTMGVGEAPWTVTLQTPATPQLGWYHHSTGGDFNASKIFTGYTVPLNTWIYVTITRTVSTRTLRLYINGTEVTNACGGACTYTTADLPQASTSPIRICVDQARTSTRYANIELDEVRLYDYVLSQTQITQLAIAPAAPGGVQLR